MLTGAEELLRQIEAAFDYRGHVSVKLKTGPAVEGFLFNRQLDAARAGEEPFIELYLKGSAEYRKLRLSELESIALTGEDCAAGKSYDDHLKKKPV